jgi:histidinol phosphatase-like enzyme
MRLCLLDRDGVVVVNRSDNIKRPGQLTLIAGAAEAIARLNRAGVTVAICNTTWTDCSWPPSSATAGRRSSCS